jgi:hypothetical protein
MGVGGQLYAPTALYPRGKDPRYPLYSRLGGPQSRSEHRDATLHVDRRYYSYEVRIREVLCRTWLKAGAVNTGSASDKGTAVSYKKWARGTVLLQPDSYWSHLTALLASNKVIYYTLLSNLNILRLVHISAKKIWIRLWHEYFRFTLLYKLYLSDQHKYLTKENILPYNMLLS